MVAQYSGNKNRQVEDEKNIGDLNSLDLKGVVYE